MTMIYNYFKNKICRECGTEIIEIHESPLYECERCIGRHEE